VLRWRQRSASADFVICVIDGYISHRTGRNSALITHYGFISVFPLIVVFTTILGFVLQDRPDVQERLVDSALSNIPVVGQQITSDPTVLRGSVLLLVGGLLAALWSGLRAFLAIQSSLDDIEEIEPWHRSNPAVIRLHGLIGIGTVGGAQIVTAALTALVAITDLPSASKAMLVLASFVVNTAVVALCYRWLLSRRTTWGVVAPGAIIVGVVFTALQLVGTNVVGRAIARASLVYGTFASVIGLFTWLGLHSWFALVGAEFNRALRLRQRQPVVALPVTETTPANATSADDEPTITE
jgi:membrane protein